MAKECKEGATIVEIEFSNYVKDRIDEVVASGYFGDINDFMQYAALSAIFDYERYKNELKCKKIYDATGGSKMEPGEFDSSPEKQGDEA